MDVCGREENVVRAITAFHYDVKRGRLSSALFKGVDISVSRLSCLPLESIIRIFKDELSDPEKPLLLAGEIKVSKIWEIGENFNRNLRVVPDPSPANKSHALVNPRGDNPKITSGLAKSIARNLILHDID